jgi:subtilisin family serine protease
VNAPQNWKGKSLVSTGATQVFNGPTQTNPSRVIATIPLTASSIIGIADTGITRQNCYFCSSLAGPSCHNRAATSDSSRNIFMYWFIGPDQCAQCGRCGNVAAGTSVAQGCGNDFDENGHGTHVASSIVGSSDQTTSPDSVRNNGIAGAVGNPTATSAGAKLFFQDVLNNSSDAECLSAGLKSGCGDSLSIPTALENLFLDPYMAGVRVHCNSWGCVRSANRSGGSADACNTYNSQARDIDAFNTEGSARSRQDFLVVLAAGNDGLMSLDASVVSPSTCKNCLVVGASESNAEQLAADAVYVDPNMFCTQNMQPRPCCSGLATGRCNMNDCCDAAVAASLCYACCNVACRTADAPSSQNLAAFSSRGPTSDGRFKPDVVAPGTSVLSANTLFPGYPLSSNYTGRYCETNPSAVNFAATQALQLRHGSSSAAALVAGFAEYVRQYFLQVWNQRLTTTIYLNLKIFCVRANRDSIRRVRLLEVTVSLLFLKRCYALSS